MAIALGRPDDNRKRDLDNVAGKALLDLLVAHHDAGETAQLAIYIFLISS